MRRCFCLAVFGLWLAAGVAHAQSTVQLIEAGAAPREALRYRFAADRSERAALDTNLQMLISMGGQVVPMPAVPPIHMVMSLRSREVGADGSARVEFELVSVQADSADPAQAAQVDQAMNGVKGMSGWYRISPNGAIGDGGLNAASDGAAPGANDVLGNFRESMQQFAAPFPAEAVGIGARWRVQQNGNTGGMQVSQTAEYTLRARTLRQVSLDVKIVDSKVEPGSALPVGAQIDAVKIEGSGTTVLDLDRMVPTADMNVATHVALSSSAQGQAQSMALDLTLKQRVAPATN